ncbi:MarR family winged helix-turn-helix transcriptional regulator [Marinibaculum pumilum]|uniref:MarR family winged helix-turn-helix transcriptional regulator n=1 Tax=Marinibaculum pumilum TaxID=1766165 RepID=A0ABV7L5L7_9PROT
MDLPEIFDRTVMPLTYRLGYLVNYYREPLMRDIEGRFGLIRPEWTVLLCLSAQQGLTASDICDMTGHLRAAVSRGVGLLEKKGLIERVGDESDGRRLRLFLTGRGREVFARIEPLLQAREDALLARLSAAERERLRRQLDHLCERVRALD